MRRLILLTAAWLILGSAGSLFAQGVQTGTIRGMVKDQQDLAVPGVTVTATSPALQGPRSTVTDKEGLSLRAASREYKSFRATASPRYAQVVVPLGSCRDERRDAGRGRRRNVR